MGFTIADYNSGAEATALLNESLKVPLRILLRCLKSDYMNTPPLSVWGKSLKSQLQNEALTCLNKKVIYFIHERTSIRLDLSYFIVLGRDSMLYKCQGTSAADLNHTKPILPCSEYSVFSPLSRSERIWEAQMGSSEPCKTRSLLNQHSLPVSANRCYFPNCLSTALSWSEPGLSTQKPVFQVCLPHIHTPPVFGYLFSCGK